MTTYLISESSLQTTPSSYWVPGLSTEFSNYTTNGLSAPSPQDLINHTINGLSDPIPPDLINHTINGLSAPSPQDLINFTINELSAPTPQDLINHTINVSTANSKPSSQWTLSDQAMVLIPLYSTILLLSVVGNCLVIATLLQKRLMRTPTNMMLLNLALSDLLLGMFCMPFTLTGSILRDFIFGHAACRIIPYLQGEFNSIKVNKRSFV